MKYLHGHSEGKIIHRDIKPLNILISLNGIAKLADFGVSRFIPISDSRTVYTLTELSDGDFKMAGTHGWMAPEMYAQERFTDRIDIFSLGCVFGFSLSDGIHPFGEKKTKEWKK